jgi:lysyl-tRNA synthetase, class II
MIEPLEAVRVEKLKSIEALGYNPYPTEYRYTHTIEQIVEKFQAKPAEELESPPVNVRVAGRILASRPFGKAGFLALSDGGSRLQVYAKKDQLPERDFQLYQLLDIGDFIGVQGTLFRTRTGELTVLAKEIVFLAKSFLTLPEKWHGLTDVEVRYRRRYVDLVVNPEVRDVFVKRSLLIRELRRFLDEQGYFEVETPILHPIAGGALAKPFRTHHNALDMPLYLRIAPELYLKRLIVGGLNRVYDLNRNFRNEGVSYKHNPEYTMLEFYQAYSNYHDLMDLTEEMLKRVVDRVCGKRQVTFGSHTIDFDNWTRITMADAIVKYSDDRITPEDLKNREFVQKMLHSLHAEFNPRMPLGNLIGVLFETVAERHLIQPTIVYEHPVELSPLAKKKQGDPSIVERFELFIAGMELANAYSELNDPVDQAARFRSQLEARDLGDEEAHEMDEDYVRALSYGMPPTAGEGIGVDRLTMILTDSKSIRDVILFPHMRPE